MKYVELQANFRVLGNTEDGLDDNYDTYRVGVNGVVSITENNKNQNSDAYDVAMDDGSVCTVWNPLWARMKRVPCEEGEAVAHVTQEKVKDIDKLKALLREFGVGFEVRHGNLITGIVCKQGAAKVGGYDHFLTSFDFDKDGDFLLRGAFE